MQRWAAARQRAGNKNGVWRVRAETGGASYAQLLLPSPLHPGCTHREVILTRGAPEVAEQVVTWPGFLQAAQIRRLDGSTGQTSVHMCPQQPSTETCLLCCKHMHTLPCWCRLCFASPRAGTQPAAMQSPALWPCCSDRPCCCVLRSCLSGLLANTGAACRLVSLIRAEAALCVCVCVLCLRCLLLLRTRGARLGL